MSDPTDSAAEEETRSETTDVLTNVAKSQPSIDDEAVGLSWRDRLRLIGWVPASLLAVAFVMLLVGGVNAWRAEASTALLIVGAILAVLALVVGRDWREIELRYGDAQARVLRGVEHVLEQAEQSSPSAEWRQQIVEIRSEVEELAEQTRRERRRTRTPTASRPPAGLLLTRPQASHTFIGNSSVMLMLQVPSQAAKDPHTCVVVTPAGERLAKEIRPPILGALAAIAGGSFTVWYPDQFLASSPLEPGLYEVEWRRGSAAEKQEELEAAVSALVAALGSVEALLLVARDSFTIPERQASFGSTPATD